MQHRRLAAATPTLILALAVAVAVGVVVLTGPCWLGGWLAGWLAFEVASLPFAFMVIVI